MIFVCRINLHMFSEWWQKWQYRNVIVACEDFFQCKYLTHLTFFSSSSCLISLRYLVLSVSSPCGVPGWRKSQYSNLSKNFRAMVGWLVYPTTHSVSLDITSYGAACAFTLATVRTSWATTILHFMQVPRILRWRNIPTKSLNISKGRRQIRIQLQILTNIVHQGLHPLPLKL